MRTEILLTVGGTIIALRSAFPLGSPKAREKAERQYCRYKNFIYRGSRRPQIVVTVSVVPHLPRVRGRERFFVTRHFQNRRENWRFGRQGEGFVYQSPVAGREMCAFIDRGFCRVKVLLLPQEDKTFSWQVSDVLDDFLHVLLINHLAQRESGLFAHAAGIRDTDGAGMLFCGRSGAGKTTSAFLWHSHARAQVLNDDRVIVRRHGDTYRIHSTPWHGEFYLNFRNRLEPAALRQIFFLYHARDNTCRRINPASAFSRLYATIFPPFWDRACLGAASRFITRLVTDVPCYRLGFVNDRHVIGFVRAFKTKETV